MHMPINENTPRKPDKSRFVLSKETLKEFNLKPNEVPIVMREELPSTFRYTNHVNQNRRVVK